MRGCRRHQPPDLTCPTCAGRYARRVARTILATNPRRLFAVAFDTTLSPEQFRCWRTAARNLVDHQRRECRWWRGVSMQVWLSADGWLRGVVSLDAITTEEFTDAFTRWPVSLRSIEGADVAGTIYAAVAPSIVASGGQGGYQGVRFTLKPQMTTARHEPVAPSTLIQPAAALLLVPMPCAFI